MPTVLYGSYYLSDSRLREKLQLISEALGRDIRVTSGDRNFTPKGSSRNSLHLINEAVDFHVVGLGDAEAFRMLRNRRAVIFGHAEDTDYRWQLIQHGAHTSTGGPHLHLGYSTIDGPTVLRGFIVEGLFPRQPYTQVERP